MLEHGILVDEQQHSKLVHKLLQKHYLCTFYIKRDMVLLYVVYVDFHHFYGSRGTSRSLP